MTLPLSFEQPSFFDYTLRVRVRFHRFLLFLMMLALPVQTFASAAMLDCTFTDQTAVAPMAMAGEVMAGCHEPQQPDSPPAQHDCKHCAACALAAVLLIPATDRAAVVPVSIHFLSQPAASFSGFVPSGPERPPRASLA
ncbi:MAG: hypothetical protein Q8N48_07600 [Thiobacillus sp.]|nr:hypothetical protein [Thiobacillus sp.]MDP2978673.1 hypothetical protein [Thiobacillus sp.]